MKAFQCVELAGPEKLILSDIDDQKPGNGEVLIEIKAASVNFPDVLMIQGLYQVQPQMPFIPGAECSGVVAEIGEGVESCNVGDHVFVMAGNGCFAEKIVVEAARVVLIPKEMDFQQNIHFLPKQIHDRLHCKTLRLHQFLQLPQNIQLLE